jgi:hypothetical protein
MITPKFKAKFANNNLIFLNKAKFYEYLGTLPPKDLEVVVKVFRKQRSNLQNGFFHGVIVPLIAEEIGHSLKKTKALLKSEFLKEIIIVNDEEFEFIRPTSSLTTTEFEEFNDKIRIWAFDFLNELVVPYPDKVDYPEASTCQD